MRPGAFLAASIAMWWHVRSGARYAPAVFAVCAFASWIAILRSRCSRSAQSTRSPRAAWKISRRRLRPPTISWHSSTWFRQAAPANGFGLGAVPWCGFTSAPCAGVPAQIHSDYTFTALVGVFGWSAAWALTLGCALWLHRLIRHHGRVTRGEPRFVKRAGRVVADNQAFLSWVGVAWVVLTLCQLAVTVAGNVAVLPLTGVTFPS